MIRLFEGDNLKLIGWVVILLITVLVLYLQLAFIPKHRFNSQAKVENGETTSGVISFVAVIIFFLILYNS
jgi:uncharacterized membrane protein YjfL (UPF0719 family)